MGSLKCKSLDGLQDLLFPQSLAHLRDVRCLDSLVRAHVLLAVMAERASPEHQLNLLRAFTFVLQIWQVLPPGLLSRGSALWALATPKSFWIECGRRSFAQCVSFQVSMTPPRISPDIKKNTKPQTPSSDRSKSGKKVNIYMDTYTSMYYSSLF